MRFCLRGALTLGWAWLLAGSLAAADPADTGATPTIYVQARENLSGFNGNELVNFLARTMSGAQAGPWRFAVSEPGKTPPDRVEWSFIPGAEAAGSVRTYGFSRAMMTRLIGSSRVFTVEARLYLRGEYEALASGQFRQTDDPQDSDLANQVGVIARALMATPGVIERASHPIPPAQARPPTM